MQAISAEQELQLVNLANVTYQSSHTKEIQNAVHIFTTFMTIRYPKSFSKVQELITKKQQLCLNTRKALVSLYKISGEHFKQIIKNRSRFEQDILSSHKQLLYTVQHAFDNQQIQSSIKHPISILFIDIFTLFNPDNFERLISKTKYYFNTKQDQLALDIFQVYHQSKNSFKYKNQFYGPCLRTLFDFLNKKLKIVYNSQFIDDKFCRNLTRHMALLQEIFCSLTFQTYQSILIQLFQEPGFYQTFVMMFGQKFPINLLHNAFQIAQHVISGLTRTKMITFPNYKELVNILVEIARQEFNNLLGQQMVSDICSKQHETLKMAKMNYLIACCDCTFNAIPLIQFKPTFFQFYTRLIYPNIKAIQNYSNDITQICNLTEDLTYDMNSQCIEVVTHKLIISLCKSSEENHACIRMMVSSFLFEYLPIMSNQMVQTTKSSLFINKGIPFWEEINFIDIKERIISILHFTALAVNLFISDFQFLSSLNKFMGTNSQFLLLKDPQIAFYSLLIYKNYKEDIFSDNHSSAFKMHFINLALQGENSIIRELSINILQEYLNQKPPFDQVLMTVQHLINSFLNLPGERLLPILEAIFKHYGNNITKFKQTAPLIQLIMSGFTASVINKGNFHQNQIYLQIISHFLNIKEFLPFFPDLITKILQTFEAIPNKQNIEGDQLLLLLVKALKKIGQLPPITESLLIQFKWSFENIQLVNTITEFLRYTQSEMFVNWLFENLINQDFSTHTCLLMHNVIYYKIKKVNPNCFKSLIEKIYHYRMLNRLNIDYINGKLNIMLLLMMKLDRPMFHSYLEKSDWIQLQQNIRKSIIGRQIFDNNKMQNRPFIDQIYRFIYVSQHSYRWQYDIKIFLSIQLNILQTSLHQQYQFKYANLSFVACIKNILRAYEIINSNVQIDDYSSEQLIIFPEKQYDLQQLHHHKTIKKFILPEQFTQDYFLQFRTLIQKLKSTPQSNQWLHTIINTVFDQEDKYHLEQIINSHKMEDNKIRKIVRVNR